MLFEDTEILEFNQSQKPDKAPFTIYADLERLKEKTGGGKNNLENSTKTKVSEHIQSEFFLSAISPFKITENKQFVERGKDYEKVC